MKRIVAFSVLLVLLLLASCDLFKPAGPETLSNEEHTIISAVLDSMMQSHAPETIDIFDQTSTATNSISLNIAFERDSIGSQPLLVNYDTANRKRYALDMDKLPNYVMLKDTEEAEPYSGYFSFTRPGISDDGLWAIVEYSFMSAPLAGCGMAAVLEKKFGEWVVVWDVMIWVS